MTHAELFQLRKSYDPDMTVYSEMAKVKKEINALYERFQRLSADWSFRHVEEWTLAMRQKREYLSYLEKLSIHDIA
jgi:hypothetical protein